MNPAARYTPSFFHPRLRACSWWLAVCLLLAPWTVSFLAHAAEAVPPAQAALAADALFEQVLALNRVQEPELDLAAARAAFQALVEKSRAALAGAVTPREKIAALNRVLL